MYRAIPMNQNVRRNISSHKVVIPHQEVSCNVLSGLLGEELGCC